MNAPVVHRQFFHAWLYARMLPPVLGSGIDRQARATRQPFCVSSAEAFNEPCFACAWQTCNAQAQASCWYRVSAHPEFAGRALDWRQELSTR